MRLDICAYDSPSAGAGPASWLQRVPKIIAEHGFELRVHLFCWDSPQDGTLRRYLQQQGISFTTSQFGSSVQNVKWLLDCVAQDPPVVFIADNVIPGLLCTRYLKSWGIRTVGILRSDDAFYHGIVERFVGGRDCDRLDAVVCVSEFLTERAMLLGRGRLRCLTIPSGAPVPLHHGCKSDARWQIVYSGRLVQEQKRILDTARCLAELVRRCPSVRAVIAGTGPESDGVAAIAAESEGRLELWGRQTEPQMQQLFAESHAILLLSDYEGTPSAIMEAMAHGVVPICLNIRSGIPELVLDGQTGLLVTDRWDSVFRAVEKLLADPSLYRRLSLAARQRIIERFSIQISADRWVSMLRELTSEAVVGRPVAMPARLELPKAHSGYLHQDIREPDGLAKLCLRLQRHLRSCRKTLGKWRRLLLNIAGTGKSDA